MDLILHELRSAIRRPPQRLLTVGDLPRHLDFSEQHRVHVAGLDDVNAAEDCFDLILWRPVAAWNDRLLAAAAEKLSDTGRLWIITRPSLRRRLIIDSGRLGFAVLDERLLNEALLLELRHDGYVVRAYEPGDEADILSLFAPAFHVGRSLEHFQWKYRDNPWGRELITIARAHQGELAAHYAGYPTPFWHAERRETMLGLQIGDTMTDPRFRRAGRGVSSLLGRCFRHFFARNCDQRVAFNFGFNTGNIRRFNFQFIKGHLAQQVDYWRRDVAKPSSAGYSVRQIERFDARFDRFFYRVAKHYGFLVRRDARWLDWRYTRCPDAPPFVAYQAVHRGQLVAWSIFRRRGDQLLWVDALADPRHAGAANDLLRAALEDPALQGAQEVAAWFPSNPEAWRHQIEMLGFQNAPEPNDLALIYLPFTRPEAADLLPTCYYTMGDSDLA